MLWQYIVESLMMIVALSIIIQQYDQQIYIELQKCLYDIFPI